MGFKIFILFFILQMGFAQQRTCGSNDLMQKIFQNEKLKERYLSQQKLFQEKLNNANKESLESFKAKLRIPVAIHFPGGNEKDRDCLVELAQSQVDVLNQDFTGTNSDISEWEKAKVNYPNVNVGKYDVQFELGYFNHPLKTDSDLKEGEPAVTIGYNFGKGENSDAAWNGYLNFVVRPIKDSSGNTNSILGQSPVGGIVLDGDAILINVYAFGTGTGCNGTPYIPRKPFNLGRTATHELGHFFNLAHTFGNELGCVNSNTDQVSDTPKVGTSTSGCPDYGSVEGCEKLPALTMNYMDYVNDPCMFMFTVGQRNRMNAQIEVVKRDFVVNAFTNTANNANRARVFTLYPNPVSKGFINIEFENPTTEYFIEIYDITGKLVWKKNKRRIKVTFQRVDDIPPLSPGIYFIKVDDYTKSITRKVVFE
jgi:hypothetical protein